MTAIDRHAPTGAVSRIPDVIAGIVSAALTAAFAAAVVFGCSVRW